MEHSRGCAKLKGMESLPQEGLPAPGYGFAAASGGAATPPGPDAPANRLRTCAAPRQRPCVWRGVLWLLFLLQAGLVCCHTRLPGFGPQHEQLLRAGLLLVATGLTCAWLARVLPLENVLLAGMVIVLTSAVASILISGAVLLVHRQSAASALAAVSWRTSLAWVVVALNSRGVARLFLKSLRAHYFYGFWLLALSAGLSVPLFCFWGPALGLDSVPRSLNGGILLKELLACAELALVALTLAIFTTPALINKRPGAQPPPVFDPVFLSVILTLVAFWS